MSKLINLFLMEIRECNKKYAIDKNINNTIIFRNILIIPVFAIINVSFVKSYPFLGTTLSGSQTPRGLYLLRLK